MTIIKLIYVKKMEEKFEYISTIIIIIKKCIIIKIPLKWVFMIKWCYNLENIC